VNTFTCRCIAETTDGLCDGLSHFSGQSRAAIIYAPLPDDQIYIYDPQDLLYGHEPKIKDLYLASNAWREVAGISADKKKYSDMIPEKNLELAGLISYGGRSSAVFYQMWFTDHHPDMCSTGPTERWLEHAAWRFSHDLANDEVLYTGISGSFLREYSTHAVRDYIVDQMNIMLGWDTQIRVFPILDAVLGISKTREEGSWPRGELVFAEKNAIPELKFIARFPEMEQPSLAHFKHIRKLLQAVEQSDRKLISNGKSIVGIAIGEMPEFRLSADYRGRHGFLKLSNNKICSFSDGGFKSTTYRANLVQVEEALLESDLDSSSASTLLRTVKAIVRHAEIEKHGCTIVLDLNAVPIAISGQKLEKPLNLKQPELLELTQSLSKIDGALHIGGDLNLHGFACLLDGRAIPGEDRSRGARFNSALRFTAEHDNVLVVVVSSDRPVSVILEGVELSAQCEWKPFHQYYAKPLTLEQWVNDRGS